MNMKNGRLAQEVEEIENLLGKLKEQSDKGIPLLVEGKRDVEALNRLEISGKLIELKSSRKSVFNLLEHDVEDREVIILTDFDRRGSDLAKSIHNHFQGQGEMANMLFWKRMKRLVGRNVKDVEGLPSYLATLRRLSSNPA
jgi:5S rRNA maturation endonuclease (ribonuclease M5)